MRILSSQQITRTAPTIRHGTKRNLVRPRKVTIVRRHFSCATTTLLLDGLVVSNYQTQISLASRHSESHHVLACSSSSMSESLVQQLANRLKRFFRWLCEAFIVSSRSLEVAVRFFPLIVFSPTAVISERLFGNKEICDFVWWYTLKTLQALGPAWQKLGQWAATRRDVFPAHVCDRLSKLHDRGFPHPWEHTHAILEESFGRDYRSKGLKIDMSDQEEALIGCGSAGQVYRGLLTETNGSEREVAVKVLHPRFDLLVERDVALMSAIANLLHSLPIQFIHVLNLPYVANDFGNILRQQADLRVEGRNLERFRYNFYGLNDENLHKSSVVFPRPIKKWTASNVLVEDFVKGAQPISDFLKDSSKEGLEIRKELAGPLLRAFLKMVFVDSWVHCDLHPGNVMVQTKTQENGKVKRFIVFLDTGIATTLSPSDQQNLIDLFRAVLLNDGFLAGKLMIERAKNERCSQVEGSTDAFAHGIEQLVSEFHDRRRDGLTLGAVNIGSLLGRVLNLCRVYNIEIDPAMASTVLSTLVLEGLGRSLHPDLNLIDFAIPFVLGRGKV